MNDAGDEVVIERLSSLETGDLAAITALESQSFSNPWTPAALAEMLRSDVTRLYVARAQARQVIAFCACWVIGEELHVNTLAVAAPYRRQGVATRLLRFVLASTGAQRATLEVRRSNTAALGLYAGLGFQTVAIREGYYSNPDEDGLILWLNP
jgi:ribosomal-protein-alanine N-acetyltransferase